MTTTAARQRTLAEIRRQWEAEERRPLTAEEIDAILPSEITSIEDNPTQLQALRSYIEDHVLEEKAARQLRDRGIAEERKTGASRQAIADLSGTSVPHVAACIGRRVPGVHGSG